jgi:hypothetical protein
MTNRVTFHDSYWYCYANCTAMLLSAHGELISPRLIEVLSGVGLGASIGTQDLPFFSGLAGLPDRGITQALSTLGFAFTEEASDQSDSPPFGELATILEASPAIVGPVDMSFLAYNSGRPSHPGVDHYILVDRIEGNRIFAYDPAGFGQVFLTRGELADAWRADAINYKRGHYRYWSNPHRVVRPTEEEIAAAAGRFFKTIYHEADRIAAAQGRLTDERAITWLADVVRRDALTPAQQGHLLRFALPLGVKRALDFSDFFATRNAPLARLEQDQAALFGACVAHLARHETEAASEQFFHLASLETQIRQAVASL